MGNQLSSIAPSQILSVDHYFADLNDYDYDIRYIQYIFQTLLLKWEILHSTTLRNAQSFKDKLLLCSVLCLRFSVQ